MSADQKQPTRKLWTQTNSDRFDQSHGKWLNDFYISHLAYFLLWNFTPFLEWLSFWSKISQNPNKRPPNGQNKWLTTDRTAQFYRQFFFFEICDPFIALLFYYRLRWHFTPKPLFEVWTYKKFERFTNYFPHFMFTLCLCQVSALCFVIGFWPKSVLSTFINN